MKENIQDLANEHQVLAQNPSAVVNRQNSPTSDDHGNNLRCNRTMTKRRSETFNAALRIHGGTSTNPLPAVSGLVDTLAVKCSEGQLTSVISRKRKLCNQVFPQIYNTSVKKFEDSQENRLRSISTYFTKGVIGKRKYRSLYRVLSMKKSKRKGKKHERIKIMSCKVARLLPYNKMMDHVKSIDIGKIGNVREDFCNDMDEWEQGEGCYRHLSEFLPLLASFYSKLSNEEGLLWFNNEVNTFVVALGGDGAPFGKQDTACSWLCSFLNRGKHVLSSNENFLIFGANCHEDSLVVQRYVKFLFNEISHIEKQIFSVDGVDFKFRFSEFPNDLKMLAVLAGELPVSARYFSTFANVNTNNCDNPSGTFGQSSNDTWQPWKYNKRLEVAQGVAKLRGRVEKLKCTKATKRKKILDFISDKNSRQEFEPLIGPFIDRAHIDPLHAKNNACQQLFRKILYESIAKTPLPGTRRDFESLPASSPFVKLVICLQKNAKLARLANKVKQWFNEGNGSDKDFQYRFTGQDSRLFLHNFMYVIDAVKEQFDSKKQTFALHVFAYLCLQLRQIVSLFCRVVNITAQDIQTLKHHCTNFFRASCLFSVSITPTVWGIGHLIPAHALEVYRAYGLGLNVVSMEGHEAKHVAISRNSQNTNFSGRWEQIFRYEFVQLIWLRERGHFDEEHNSSRQTYIPPRVSNEESCFCGFDKADQERCPYCLHRYRKQIEESVESCKLLVDKNVIS